MLISFPSALRSRVDLQGVPADLLKIKHNRIERSLFSRVVLFKYLLKWENKADISAAARTRTKRTPVKPWDSFSYAADIHSWAAKYTTPIKQPCERNTDYTHRDTHPCTSIFLRNSMEVVNNSRPYADPYLNPTSKLWNRNLQQSNN